MTRTIDPAHAYVAAIVGQLGELRPDGAFSEAAIADLDGFLLGLSHEALADSLWHALAFAAFVEVNLGGEPAAAQLLELVEKHAARLPADAQREFQAERASARVVGSSASVIPVGAAPAPEGSVRGGLAARLASTKKP